MAERLFIWAIPIPRSALADVRTALREIGAEPADNPWLPFGRLPMLHFASLTLFVGDGDGSAATLVFESNVDHPVGDYVRELVRVGRRGLDRMLGACARYPAAHAPAPAVVEFLARYKKSPQLYHIGHPNRSLQEIRGDCELRRSIEPWLRDPQLAEQSPADIVAFIRHEARCPCLPFLRRRPWHPTWNDPPSENPTPLHEIQWLPDTLAWQAFGRGIALIGLGVLVELAAVVFLGWGFAVPRKVTLVFVSAIFAFLVHMSAQDTRMLRSVLSSFGVGLLTEVLFQRLPPFEAAHPPGWLAVLTVSVLVPVLIVGASYVNILLRVKVTLPLPALSEAARRRVGKLLDAEDCERHSIYNHVAGLSKLKDRFRLLRCFRTWLALQFLNLFYRTYFVRGKLASIPSIHFAGWTLIDSRRLLFLTNYDGSADSYLDDFFNTLAAGVAFIWYDTRLFPGTTDPRLLKMWVRTGQTLARIRYRAPVYDALSVAAINNNTYIRTRLLRGRGQGSARRWLRRFATTPVEPTVLVRLTTWVKDLAGVSE